MKNKHQSPLPVQSDIASLSLLMMYMGDDTIKMSNTQQMGLAHFLMKLSKEVEGTGKDDDDAHMVRGKGCHVMAT